MKQLNSSLLNATNFTKFSQMMHYAANIRCLLLTKTLRET